MLRGEKREWRGSVGSGFFREERRELERVGRLLVEEKDEVRAEVVLFIWWL